MSWKKELVEHSLMVSVFRLRRLGFFRDFCSGIVSWKNAYEEELGKISLTVSLGDSRWPSNRIQFQYSYTDYGSGETNWLDYWAEIVTTNCRYGGYRYWFLCPLWINGHPCHRRVAVLYKPPSCSLFGCRLCHDLTYKSSQESHKYDWLYKQPGFEGLGYI